MALLDTSEEDLKEASADSLQLCCHCKPGWCHCSFLQEHCREWAARTRSLRLPLEPHLSWAVTLLEASLTDPGSVSLEPRLPLIPIPVLTTSPRRRLLC